MPPEVTSAINPAMTPASETLYLGRDPYSLATFRLQYDSEDKTLEWQLLNSGYVLSSQIHELPEDTLTVDNGLVLNGDLIVVAGRTINERWFIRALNSQGEFQWQSKGEGRIYDLAFSNDGQTLYAVGATKNNPLLFEVNAQSGAIGFNSAIPDVNGNSLDNDDVGSSYKQIVVVGNKEVVVAQHWEAGGRLKLVKWWAEVDPQTGEAVWQIVPDFCQGCERTGMQSVALKRGEKQQRFYAITSDGSQLEFSIQGAVDGVSLMTRKEPVESGSGFGVGFCEGILVTLSMILILVRLTRLLWPYNQIRNCSSLVRVASCG